MDKVAKRLANDLALASIVLLPIYLIFLAVRKIYDTFYGKTQKQWNREFQQWQYEQRGNR